MDEDKPLLTIVILTIIFFVVGIVILFLTAIVPEITGANRNELRENYEQHLEKRLELIQLVETYQLEYDETGLITNLDKVGLSGLAHNDKIYVVYQEEELIVEFVYTAGFPDEGQSIMYSSGGEELLKDKLNESIYAFIAPIEDNWYFVQYN